MIAVLAFVTVGLVELLSETRPPKVAPGAALMPPLTKHLSVWLLDAVRHDVAVDASYGPHLARHMREDAHALLWAGRVTMT